MWFRLFGLVVVVVVVIFFFVVVVIVRGFVLRMMWGVCFSDELDEKVMGVVWVVLIVVLMWWSIGL